MIQDHEGNAPQNATNTDNRGQSCTIYADKTRHCAVSGQVSAATRYGPGEVSRRLALCSRLIDRKRAVLFALAALCNDAASAEARAHNCTTAPIARVIGRTIAALWRLQQTFLRLQLLAKWAVSADTSEVGQ
jgi:hypothetical protein